MNLSGGEPKVKVLEAVLGRGTLRVFRDDCMTFAIAEDRAFALFATIIIRQYSSLLKRKCKSIFGETLKRDNVTKRKIYERGYRLANKSTLF